MPTDTLTGLDPASVDDGRFDPHGSVAERVLAGALAPAPARSAPVRRRAAVLGTTAVAATAVVAGVAITGSGGDALRPAAALAAAVERTAAFDSGRALVHTVVRGPDGTVDLDARHEIRFAPDASETTQRAAAGTPEAGTSLDGAVWRTVEGRSFLKREGGAWQPMPDAAPRDPLADEARAIVGDRALADLVRRADGVTQDGSTFRATLDGAAIRTLERPPFAIGELRDLDRVDLEMTVAGDGTIAELVVGYGDVTRTITYDALGEPQEIPVP